MCCKAHWTPADFCHFAFILMLAFLVAMAWDSFSRTRELLSSQAYVEHTHQVLYELDAIQDGLGDAREAWLHYILTPEKQDLDTFDDSYKEVWKRVARVEDLSKDDPAQQERIKQLQVWIAEELQQLRDNLRTNKTLLIYHSPATDFKQDRVRNAVQKFKSEQEKSPAGKKFGGASARGGSGTQRLSPRWRIQRADGGAFPAGPQGIKEAAHCRASCIALTNQTGRLAAATAD